MTGAHGGQCMVRSNASLVLARWDRPFSFEQNNGQTRLKILRSHNFFGGRLLTKDAQSETKKARGNSCCDVASKTVTNDFLCVIISGGSRIFPRGAPTPKIAIIFHIFTENCMKTKEFGPPGGERASLAPPLGSANDNNH